MNQISDLQTSNSNLFNSFMIWLPSIVLLELSNTVSETYVASSVEESEEYIPVLFIYVEYSFTSSSGLSLKPNLSPILTIKSPSVVVVYADGMILSLILSVRMELLTLIQAFKKLTLFFNENGNGFF